MMRKRRMIPEPIPPEPRKPNWFLPSAVTGILTELEKKEEQRKEDELFLTAYSKLPIEKRIQLEQEERDYVSSVLSTGRLTKVKTQIGSTSDRKPIFNGGITEMTATDFGAWSKENTPIELPYDLSGRTLDEIGAGLGPGGAIEKGWSFDDDLQQTWLGVHGAKTGDGNVLMFSADEGRFIFGTLPHAERQKLAGRTNSGENARGTFNQPELTQRARVASTMTGTKEQFAAAMTSADALAMLGGASTLEIEGRVTWPDRNGSPVTLTKEELDFYTSILQKGFNPFDKIPLSDSEEYARIDEKINSYAQYIELPDKMAWKEALAAAGGEYNNDSFNHPLLRGGRTDVITALNTSLTDSYNTVIELRNLLVENNGPFSKGNLNYDYYNYFKLINSDPQNYLSAVDPDYTPEKGLEVFRKISKENNDLIVYMMARYGWNPKEGLSKTKNWWDMTNTLNETLNNLAVHQSSQNDQRNVVEVFADYFGDMAKGSLQSSDMALQLGITGGLGGVRGLLSSVRTGLMRLPATYSKTLIMKNVIGVLDTASLTAAKATYALPLNWPALATYYLMSKTGLSGKAAGLIGYVGGNVMDGVITGAAANYWNQKWQIENKYREAWSWDDFRYDVGQEVIGEFLLGGAMGAPAILLQGNPFRQVTDSRKTSGVGILFDEGITGLMDHLTDSPRWGSWGIKERMQKIENLIPAPARAALKLSLDIGSSFAEGFSSDASTISAKAKYTRETILRYNTASKYVEQLLGKDSAANDIQREGLIASVMTLLHDDSKVGTPVLIELVNFIAESNSDLDNKTPTQKAHIITGAVLALLPNNKAMHSVAAHIRRQYEESAANEEDVKNLTDIDEITEAKERKIKEKMEADGITYSGPTGVREGDERTHNAAVALIEKVRKKFNISPKAASVGTVAAALTGNSKPVPTAASASETVSGAAVASPVTATVAPTVAAPEASVAPGAAPEAATEIAPEAALEAATEAAPEAALEAATEASVAPGAAPEAATETDTGVASVAAPVADSEVAPEANLEAPSKTASIDSKNWLEKQKESGKPTGTTPCI
jgi:hypothetical protein